MALRKGHARSCPPLCRDGLSLFADLDFSRDGLSSARISDRAFQDHRDDLREGLNPGG